MSYLTLLLILQRHNSSSSSKSAHSTFSMHKGAGPAQRKRKPHSQSPSEPAKKRRIARTPSEVQSGQGLRDGMVPSKYTRPQRVRECRRPVRCCRTVFTCPNLLQGLLRDSSLRSLWRRARKQQLLYKQRTGKPANRWTHR